MAITYDLFEPSTNQDAALEQLTKTFAPLHMKAWQQAKQAIYGKGYDLNVGAFTSMWLNRTLKIFMAYKDGKAIGYLTGMAYRPLNYQAALFQVEDWFTDNNPEVEAGLFDYMKNAIRFLGCDEILMSNGKNQPMPSLGPEWKLKNQTVTNRYVKG